MLSMVIREGSDPSVGQRNEIFTFGERLGMVLIVEAAFLSLLSVIGLLIYISFSAVKTKRRRRWSMSTPLHMYFISMLVAEIFQATGAIMNLKWIMEAGVNTGPFCIAQGMLKQIGDVSVALCTLAIAIHTFSAIVFRWSPPSPRLLSALVLSAIWIIIIVMIVVSIVTHRHDLDAYWSDTQYWCWIARRYKLQQYLMDYVFMWATAFGNIMLYIPLSLVIRGVFTVNGMSIKYRRSEERQQIVTQGSGSSSSGKGVDSIAMQMLFYPLVYTLTVLPIAIVRFRAFYDKNVPFGYTVAADVLFCCSGFFNVLLYGFTRPSLLPRRNSSMPIHSLQSPGHNISNFSFALRSPTTDNFGRDRTFSMSTRPSLPPPPHRSQMGALPDDSEIYRFESRSLNDHSYQITPQSAKSVITPSISSFRTHSDE